MLFANALARQAPGRASVDEADEQAAKAVHAKLFENYRQWCSSLEVEPHFSKEIDECGGVYGDVVLWLCVWGECANLRHLPSASATCIIAQLGSGPPARCTSAKASGARRCILGIFWTQ